MGKLVPIVSFFVAIILAMSALPASIETIQLANEVQTFRSTRATVKSLTEEKHDRGPKTQSLKYEYKVGNRKYSGDNDLTKLTDDAEDIQRLVRKEKDGSETVLIYYDPDSPGRSVIRKDINTGVSWAIIVITGLLSFATVGSWLHNRKHAKALSKFTRKR